MTSRTASAEDNLGTTAVRPGFGFDEAALARWMQQNLEGFAGPMQVRQFKGGQSNPTFQVKTPARSYVLRRKPPGPLARGAHAVDREARVIAALGKVGFPVARLLGYCGDPDVIGSEFFVMEMVEGRIFWDARFPDVPQAERPAYFSAMNATLARLHAIDPADVGLSDYGRPGNYFQRQIGLWTKSYLADTDAGRNPGMDRLIAWLPDAIPDSDETAIIHGDFRCDNLIFHPVEPRIIAVLDWELSTLGHPLADFAYHAMMYRMPPDIVAGLGGTDPVPLNIPAERAYVAEYCANTGRDGIEGYDFYIAFNFFRMAAIFHGIKGRVIRGQAVSAHSEARAAQFERLVRLAEQAAEECV